MDYTVQLKNNLISRIRDSKDLKFLKALQTIFDTSEQSLYQLSNEQEESINIGKEDIKNDNSFENKEVISEMKKWLSKK